jgi:Flp pilus assembly protein TadB
MMTKIRIVFWSVVSALAVAALAVAAFFYDRRRVTEAERKMMAEELRAKVEKLKQAEAERKAAAAVAVAKVEEQTKKEAERDSVDAANDLIASLRDGDGKGG